LKNGGFTYAICGGFALELFTNIEMRAHIDLVVCVSEKDRGIIFTFIKDND